MYLGNFDGKIKHTTRDDYDFATAVAILQGLIFATIYNPVVTVYTN
jgi:hypothetical protein